MGNNDTVKIISRDNSFFYVLLEDFEFGLGYFEEIAKNASFMDSEEILEFGIDFSLSELDYIDMMLKIREVTKNCFDLDQIRKKFILSNHIRRKSQSELNERGFTKKNLVKDIGQIILNAQKIEKAKIHFNEKTNTFSSISYTLIGNIRNRIGKIAISLKKHHSTNGEEFILVVTVLIIK